MLYSENLEPQWSGISRDRAKPLDESLEGFTLGTLEVMGAQSRQSISQGI